MLPPTRLQPWRYLVHVHAPSLAVQPLPGFHLAVLQDAVVPESAAKLITAVELINDADHDSDDLTLLATDVLSQERSEGMRRSKRVAKRQAKKDEKAEKQKEKDQKWEAGKPERDEKSKERDQKYIDAKPERDAKAAAKAIADSDEKEAKAKADSDEKAEKAAEPAPSASETDNRPDCPEEESLLSLKGTGGLPTMSVTNPTCQRRRAPVSYLPDCPEEESLLSLSGGLPSVTTCQRRRGGAPAPPPTYMHRPPGRV